MEGNTFARSGDQEIGMWYNPIMTWVLRSPLHSLLSSNTTLITYQGRSGQSKPEVLTRAAETRVMVHIHLEEPVASEKTGFW